MRRLLGSQGQVCLQGNAKGTNKPEAMNLGLNHDALCAVYYHYAVLYYAGTSYSTAVHFFFFFFLLPIFFVFISLSFLYSSLLSSIRSSFLNDFHAPNAVISPGFIDFIALSSVRFVLKKSIGGTLCRVPREIKEDGGVCKGTGARYPSHGRPWG